MSRRPVAGVMIAIAALCATALPAMTRRPPPDLIERSVTVSGRTYPYLVHLPEGTPPGGRWPVILYLHGARERGDDGRRQARGGLMKAVRRHPDRYRAILVMPQCPKDAWWPSDAMMTVALAALDEAVGEFGGDPQRLYVTGISLGGAGAWYLAAHSPGRFAAAVPVCGSLTAPGEGDETPDAHFEAIARAVGDTPVWAFHGSADRRVPVSQSRRMVAALKGAGGDVRYTEYDGVGHNAWDRAYADPELARWLLGHDRGD